MQQEKMNLLVGLYVLFICLAELFGTKTFALANIFGYQLNASVAILVFPFIFTINDIVIEVYGKKRARGVARIGLLSVAVIMLFSMVATSLPPSARFLKTEPAYDAIFSMSARIAAASLTAFIIAQVMDIYVFAKIRELLGSSKLWLRNNLSNFLAQFADTVVFITLAFYAIDRPFGDNAVFLWSIILPYWLLKCVMSVIETPLVYAGVSWLKSEKS